jgi:hypothetical protein
VGVCARVRACEEQFYYLFMVQRLHISWIISLYSVVVTDQLLTYMDNLN